MTANANSRAKASPDWNLLKSLASRAEKGEDWDSLMKDALGSDVVTRPMAVEMLGPYDPRGAQED